MNIYVGNLSYQATEEDLRQAFSEFGEVKSSSIVKDKFSGESRGFAFVEMTDAGQATAAMAALNGKDLRGRALRVNEARPKTEGGPGGGGPRGDRPRGNFGGPRSGGGGRGGDRGGGGRFDRGGGREEW